MAEDNIVLFFIVLQEPFIWIDLLYFELIEWNYQLYPIKKLYIFAKSALISQFWAVQLSWVLGIF